jgi:hypothetical protein
MDKKQASQKTSLCVFAHTFSLERGGAMVVSLARTLYSSSGRERLNFLSTLLSNPVALPATGLFVGR